MGTRNIRLIYVYTVCTNLIFFLPIVVPYYKTIGLGFRDFLISEAVFSAVVLLSEVPSGWISDTWKRKSTLMLGGFFAVLGFALLITSETLLDTMIAQGTIGIAMAMNSGTVSALLYDTLLAEERENEFRKLEGKRHAISLYSVAFACLAGALLFTVHPKLPLTLDMIVLFCAMVAAYFMIEPKRSKKSADTHIFKDMLETARYALRGHPEIAGIIMVSMVVFCATKLMMWAQQPYYADLGLQVEWFGVIMASSYILGGVAGQWSHKIEHLGSNKFKLGFMAAILSAACAFLWALPSLSFGIPLFLLGTLAYGMGHPAVQSAINSRVGSERRATILSTASLMVHVLFIPTSLMLAWIESMGSVRESLLALGIQVALMAGVGLWLWKPSIDRVPA